MTCKNRFHVALIGAEQLPAPLPAADEDYRYGDNRNVIAT
jgi:hypothetical protein